MTPDVLVCKIAGIILLALFLVLARLLTVTRPTPEPEQASEQEPDDDYYYRVTPERITTGAFARR